MLFEVFAVFGLRHTIHPARLVGGQAVVAGPQVVDVGDVVIQGRKHQRRLLPSLVAYPCQVRGHRSLAPCIASVFLLARSTSRGDLRSAGVSRVIARPLQHTGPHHSQRGHPLALFPHWAGYSGTYEDTRPKSRVPSLPWLLACLRAARCCLGPRGAEGALVARARPRMACACTERIGTHPHGRFSGLRVRFRAHTLHLATLAVLLSASADSHHATERLTRPYSGGPPRFAGSPVTGNQCQVAPCRLRRS